LQRGRTKEAEALLVSPPSALGTLPALGKILTSASWRALAAYVGKHRCHGCHEIIFAMDVVRALARKTLHSAGEQPGTTTKYQIER